MIGSNTRNFQSAYCERLTGEFWAEPLNAISNLSFVAAALVALIAWRRFARGDWPLAALILDVALIALGSFLFHTQPGPVTVLMDVIPIQIFVLGYLALAMRRFLGLSRWQVALALVIFVALSASVQRAFPPPFLSGSMGYAPALAALYILGGILLYRARRVFRANISNLADSLEAAKRVGSTGYALWIGAAIFTLSLAFRTLDQPFCSRLPAGMHFIWHMLNGILLGWLLLAAIRHGRKLS